MYNAVFTFKGHCLRHAVVRQGGSYWPRVALISYAELKESYMASSLAALNRRRINNNCRTCPLASCVAKAKFASYFEYVLLHFRAVEVIVLLALWHDISVALNLKGLLYTLWLVTHLTRHLRVKGKHWSFSNVRNTLKIWKDTPNLPGQSMLQNRWPVQDL